MGRMGDQEIKGDLEISQTPPYPNIQPVGPQVSLVKLHKHLSVLSPPHHLLISCPSQNSSSPAKLAHQVPSLPPPGLRAKSHSYSKSFCRSLQSQEQSQAGVSAIQGPSSPASGGLLTFQLTVQPDQKNLYVSPKTPTSSLSS